MPSSVRLGRDLEIRLRQVAEAEGVRVSELVRRAVAAYVEEVARDSLRLRLSDVLGVVKSSGGRARRTGEAFRRALRRAR
jgi:predicted DNA-binding protein